MAGEPGSALSPARQVEFLKLLRRMDRLGQCQVIMATQNDPRNLPILMAYPGARLLGLTKYGLDPVTIEQTQHFRLIREFCLAPATFVETMMEESGVGVLLSGRAIGAKCVPPHYQEDRQLAAPRSLTLPWQQSHQPSPLKRH